MFGVLRLACLVLFTASIPLLVLVRFKFSKFPAWLLIVLATAVGWILPYTYTSLWAPMIQEVDRELRMANEERMRHPPPIENADGSVTVDNPMELGDSFPQETYLAADELRSNFGVVPQETVLFPGTVYQHLISAHPHATFEQVTKACQIAEIPEVIERLPKGSAGRCCIYLGSLRPTAASIRTKG